MNITSEILLAASPFPLLVCLYLIRKRLKGACGESLFGAIVSGAMWFALVLTGGLINLPYTPGNYVDIDYNMRQCYYDAKCDPVLMLRVLTEVNHKELTGNNLSAPTLPTN